MLTRILKRFMQMNKFSRISTDLLIYTGAYGIAALLADAFCLGIMRKLSEKIACWLIVAILAAIIILFIIFRKKKELSSFLNLIGNGVLDVLQLVLIYFAMFCIMIIDSPSSMYLTSGEEAAVTFAIFGTCAIWVVVFLKRLITEATSP